MCGVCLSNYCREPDGWEFSNHNSEVSWFTLNLQTSEKCVKYHLSLFVVLFMLQFSFNITVHKQLFVLFFKWKNKQQKKQTKKKHDPVPLIPLPHSHISITLLPQEDQSQFVSSLGKVALQRVKLLLKTLSFRIALHSNEHNYIQELFQFRRSKREYSGYARYGNTAILFDVKRLARKPNIATTLLIGIAPACNSDQCVCQCEKNDLYNLTEQKEENKATNSPKADFRLKYAYNF